MVKLILIFLGENMGSMSLFHWIVVLGVVLMFMGPNRFPELAKSLGKGIRDFKKALNEDEESLAEQPKLDKLKRQG